MTVLVVARTRMAGDRVCVGGIEVDTGRSLRLLGSDGWNLHEDHEIRPGEVWDLTYRDRADIEPPHVEDVIVSHGRRLDAVDDMKAEILRMVEPWRGRIGAIFDGRLQTTRQGKAFVGRQPPLPGQSTGFWTSSCPLAKSRLPEHGRRYWFPEGDAITSVKYVGMESQIDTIPAGSLIRFSLARWAAFPPGVGDERCYLQVSGWYE